MPYGSRVFLSLSLVAGHTLLSYLAKPKLKFHPGEVPLLHLAQLAGGRPWRGHACRRVEQSTVNRLVFIMGLGAGPSSSGGIAV
ncbi:hypothetical protein J6590_022851 [Homalodisca vitripennis]|nr:hypothetical protein J6590_022851 [Homalodisca vitripennis]